MKKPKGKYAWTATVGEKGQIVIPKQAREIFGIKPGDTLVLLGDEKKGIAIPPSSAFDLFAAAVFDTEQEYDGGAEDGQAEENNGDAENRRKTGNGREAESCRKTENDREADNCRKTGNNRDAEHREG